MNNDQIEAGKPIGDNNGKPFDYITRLDKSLEDSLDLATKEQQDFIDTYPEAVQIYFTNDEGEYGVELNLPTVNDVRSRSTECVIVSNEQEAEEARQEIIRSVNGWKKKYLCANAEIAHLLHKDMKSKTFMNTKGL